MNWENIDDFKKKILEIKNNYEEYLGSIRNDLSNLFETIKIDGRNIKDFLKNFYNNGKYLTIEIKPEENKKNRLKIINSILEFNYIQSISNKKNEEVFESIIMTKDVIEKAIERIKKNQDIFLIRIRLLHGKYKDIINNIKSDDEKKRINREMIKIQKDTESYIRKLTLEKEKKIK